MVVVDVERRCSAANRCPNFYLSFFFPFEFRLLHFGFVFFFYGFACSIREGKDDEFDKCMNL